MLIRCSTCTAEFDPARHSTCPTCLARHWSSAPGLTRPKHDPSFLPSGCPSFRSVLTQEFVADKTTFLHGAAMSGEFLFSNRHKKWCHFTDGPLYLMPGSGVPKNAPMPTHSLDSLLIADATGDAHAFAVDCASFKTEISAGDYVRLTTCRSTGCSNPCAPGDSLCATHRAP